MQHNAPDQPAQRRNLHSLTDSLIAVMVHLTENDPRLHDYVDDTLPASERSALEQHLARCPECAELCGQYQRLDRRLARTRRRPSLSPGFHAAILQRIERQHPSAPVKPQERQQLETRLNAQWQEHRRRFFRAQLPGFLDALGYSTAAAVGGSLLFRMIIALLRASGAATINLTPQVALAMGVGAGVVILLGGLAFVAKSRLAHWLG